MWRNVIKLDFISHSYFLVSSPGESQGDETKSLRINRDHFSSSVLRHQFFLGLFQPGFLFELMSSSRETHQMESWQHPWAQSPVSYLCPGPGPP